MPIACREPIQRQHAVLVGLFSLCLAPGVGCACGGDGGDGHRLPVKPADARNGGVIRGLTLTFPEGSQFIADQN